MQHVAGRCACLFTVAVFVSAPIPEELKQNGEGCDGRTAIGNVHENSSEVGQEVLTHCLCLHRDGHW